MKMSDQEIQLKAFVVAIKEIAKHECDESIRCSTLKLAITHLRDNGYTVELTPPHETHSV